MNILAFSPHSLIVSHSIPESIIIRALLPGNTVTILGCRGVLINRCTTQDAHGIFESGRTVQKKELCNDCIIGQKKYADIYDGRGGNYLYIDDFISEGSLTIADEAYTLSIDELINYKLEDINIGNLALYETILTFKLLSDKLTHDAEKYFRDMVYGAILIFISGEKINTKINPDVLLVYNSQYCHNQVLAKILSREGRATYSIHNSLNFAHTKINVMLIRETFRKYIKCLVNDWGGGESLKINEARLNQILNHITFSSSGLSAMSYSAGVERVSPLLKLGFDNEKPIVLAVLSSTDEFIAAQRAGYNANTNSKNLFIDQFEWIEWLLNWAKKNCDRNVVIRLHPREFPNKREGKVSESVAKYDYIFSDLPSNVRVNWPTDNISVYDFLPYLECLITSWSSIAKEVSLLGYPVVSYVNCNRSYPDGIHHVATTTDDLEKYLSVGYLSNEFNIHEQMLRALKWLDYEQFQATLDLQFTNEIWAVPNYDVLGRVTRRICKWLDFWEFFKERKSPYHLIKKSNKIRIPDKFRKSILEIFTRKLTGPHKLSFCDTRPDTFLCDKDVIDHIINYRNNRFY